MQPFSIVSCMASVSGGYPAKAAEGKREARGNAKAESRREEGEKDSVAACRGMGILPMIPTCGTATLPTAGTPVPRLSAHREVRDRICVTLPVRPSETRSLRQASESELSHH